MTYLYTANFVTEWNKNFPPLFISWYKEYSPSCQFKQAVVSGNLKRGFVKIIGYCHYIFQYFHQQFEE